MRLSAQERRLLDELNARDRDTVDIRVDEGWMLEAVTSQPRKLMWRLARKGVAHRLQGGRYLVARDELARARPRVQRLEPLVALALDRLGHRYYLSWHSALWWHGLVDQQSRRLYVAVTERKRPATLGPWSIRFVTVRPRKFFGGVAHEGEDSTLWVASVEKAIVDSFDHPELAGGIPTVAVALRRAHQRGDLDPEALVEAAIRFGSPTVNRRLGFFMDRYGIPGAEELKLRLGKGYAVPLSPGFEADEALAAVDTTWGVILDPELLNAADVPK